MGDFQFRLNIGDHHEHERHSGPNVWEHERWEQERMVRERWEESRHGCWVPPSVVVVPALPATLERANPTGLAQAYRPRENPLEQVMRFESGESVIETPDKRIHVTDRNGREIPFTSVTQDNLGEVTYHSLRDDVQIHFDTNCNSEVVLFQNGTQVLIGSQGIRGYIEPPPPQPVSPLYAPDAPPAPQPYRVR